MLCVVHLRRWAREFCSPRTDYAQSRPLFRRGPGASLTGDVQEAAILCIDLVGSTQLVSTHPPQQVAEVLNNFFRIVVDAVDARDGLIDKFEGDAALAVSGAPLRVDEAASAALGTRSPTSCASCQ